MNKPILLQCATALGALLLISANPAKAADRHVPADYATIQAAVDAAISGDTIRIGPGVYSEQINITDKNLTLVGKPGAILRAFPGMALSFPGSNSYWVGILGVFRSEVTVSGLTFEGEHLADSPMLDLGGIYFLGAGGRVEDCRFFGFRGSTLGENFFCIGVGAANPVSLGTGVVDLKVLRNTFADNARSIELFGDIKAPIQPDVDPALLRTTFTVADNTVVGNGPDATGRQFGINIGGGARGQVLRNTITDHSYAGTTDDLPYSQGLNANDGYNFGTGPIQSLHIEGNTFRDNQLHCVLLVGNDSVIVNNSFAGTAPGPRPGGLYVSGEGVMVANNRFSDMPLGILLFGDDWEFGPGGLGIASNAVLNANRFCNVTTNILAQPLTTHTEQGTLTCPFPLPELDVQKAVLLSWPGIDEGYIVETASDLEGPWSLLGATPFLQQGKNSVCTPMDANRQFFRLAKP
jgi:hypothetical protein